MWEAGLLCLAGILGTGMAGMLYWVTGLRAFLVLAIVCVVMTLSEYRHRQSMRGEMRRSPRRTSSSPTDRRR